MEQRKSVEEICKEKEVKLHMLLRDLDIWNRTVYTGFLRFTQDKDWDDFAQLITDRLEYLHIPTDYMNKWYSIRNKSVREIDIYEIAEFLHSVRRWLISEMDRLIREACEECSKLITIPPETYKKEIKIPEEEVLAPEEREILHKEKPIAEKPKPVEEKLEEVEEEEEEEKALPAVSPLALPSATMSTVDTIFERNKELVDKALKDAKILPKSDVLQKMKELHYKVLNSMDFKVTFGETNESERAIRYLKGLVIVAEKRLIAMEETDNGIEIITDKGYTVTLADRTIEQCTCKDYQLHHWRCKHIYASIVSLFVDYWKEVEHEEEH